MKFDATDAKIKTGCEFEVDKLIHDTRLRLVKGLDIVLVTIPFVACWYCYYAERIAAPFYNKGNILMVFLFLVLYCVFARVYDALLVSMNRISEMLYSQMLAILISDGIMYIVLWLLSKHFPNILPALAALAAQMILAALWCYAAHRWYFTVFPPKRSGIVYDLRQGMESLIGEYGLTKKFDIQLTTTANECVENLHMLDELDAVFVSGVHSHERNIILKYCVARRIDVYVVPRIGDVIMSGAHRLHMLHLPILRVRYYSPTPEFVAVKRLFDILMSALAVILLSPIFIVTGAAIKAEDGGPVFYKQCRLTKDGRRFNILKFRSMRVDAEKDGVARLSSGENDDRITSVGRIIRKIRVDELPQLFNILVGDMSFVGPRPERPEIAAQYEEELPEFALRLQAKAGLTGYAQVFGKYNTTPYDKLQMDLTYIAHPSLIEDLRIIFATIKILFLTESTEGVAVGATTAMGYENEVDSTRNEAETVV